MYSILTNCKGLCDMANPTHQKNYLVPYPFLKHNFLITESILCVKILFTSKACIHSSCCYKAIGCQPEFLNAISFLIWNWSCKDAFHSAFDVLCPKSLTVSGFWQAVVKKFLHDNIYLVFQYYDDDVSIWRHQSICCHFTKGLAYYKENWCK